MARYRYDLLRRRIASELHHPGGTVTRRLYLWEGPRLAAVLDGEGNVLRQFLWLGWRPVAILTPEGVFHVHTDPRGAPTEVTDEKGRIVWTADYAPFGRAAVDADPDGDGKAFVLRLRLPGQWADPATGLHYNLARWYDPESGRYLSPDPLGLAAGPNPYAYAAADPVNRIDPLGLLEISATFSVAEALINRPLTVLNEKIRLLGKAETLFRGHFRPFHPATGPFSGRTADSGRTNPPDPPAAFVAPGTD